MELEYKTKDMNEAAALSLFENFDRVERIANEVHFVFSNKVGILPTLFWSGKLCVSAYDYAMQIRKIKGVVYANKPKHESNHESD